MSHKYWGKLYHWQWDFLLKNVFRTITKKSSEISITGSLWRESTDDWWFSTQKGEKWEKHFHIMMFSQHFSLMWPRTSSLLWIDGYTSTNTHPHYLGFGVHRMYHNMPLRKRTLYYMMMSTNGSIFHVTGYLCGDFTGHWWITWQRPVTRSFNVFFDLCLNKQSWGWWFETPSLSLWRHCNHHGIWQYKLGKIFLKEVFKYDEVANGCAENDCKLMVSQIMRNLTACLTGFSS